MKRFMAVLALPMTALLTMGAATTYPPGAPLVEVDASPAAGSSTTVTVRGCEPGENVTFDLQGNVSTVVVCDDNGEAATNLTVPNAAGSYSGTADLESSGFVLNFVLSVSATSDSPLAFTGTSINYPLYLAAGAMIIGIALVVVAKTRRPQHAVV